MQQSSLSRQSKGKHRWFPQPHFIQRGSSERRWAELLSLSKPAADSFIIKYITFKGTFFYCSFYAVLFPYHSLLDKHVSFIKNVVR